MKEGTTNRVSVEILGEKYIIKSSVETEHINKVSEYLNNKLEHIQSRNPQLTAKSMALLTAFNMADDLLRLNKDYEILAELLDKQST